MKNYIGSQEHFEDEVNAYYDQKEKHDREQYQIDDRIQEDDRQQCYKTLKDCKFKCSGLCKESC